jgi:hypothetical protein
MTNFTNYLYFFQKAKCRKQVGKNIIKRTIIFFLFFLCQVQVSEAAKTDIVILKNGDHLTGELKRMEFARLTFKTDAMSTIYIEWNKIVYLRAAQTFRIELENGYDFSGSLETDSLRSDLIIVLDSLTYRESLDKIVRIIPIKDTFLKRLKFSIDLGFSYTKASDLAQLSTNLSSSLRSWQWRHDLAFNSIVTSKVDTTPAENIDLNYNLSRFFLYRWFLTGFTGVERNTELGLDLRLLLGAGGGKDIFRTNTNLLSTIAGMQVTQEWYIGESGSTSNLEAVGYVQHKKFVYDDPEIDLTTTFRIYPSLTVPGRIRFSFNTNLKWEVFSDFFWRLTFYDNYDNKPNDPGTSTNDYGITINFGWSY